MTLSSALLGPDAARSIRRVLILGHTGFIGTHLERVFRQRSPELEVIGRSAPAVDLTQEEDVHALKPLCDLDTAVLMCAAIKRQLGGDTLEVFSNNLRMAMNLCRLLQEQPVGRFVFFSSSAVYGEDVPNTQITEETPVHPTSYYGMAKYTAECLFRKVLSQPVNNAVVILRPALIYGPDDFNSGDYSPSAFVRAALNGQGITLWGDGTERREFVFIDDVVDLVYQLTFHDYCGVVNLVSGTSYTFKEAVEIISRLVGGTLSMTSRPRTKAKVDHTFCNAVLLKLLPATSCTSLDEGIRRTFEAESQRQHLRRQASAGVLR